MFETIKTFVAQNPDLIALLLSLQLALIPLSGLLQGLGFTAAARVVGVVAHFDLSGIVAYFKGKGAKAKEVASKVAAVAFVMLAAATSQGCAVFAKGVDTAQNVCETKLAVLPEVILEAQIRGVPVGKLVAAFCLSADVAAIFTDTKPSGARLATQKPEDQALALLRAKGEVQ